MDVSVQVGGGGFHAFRLAEQLHRYNKLNYFITSYPYSIFQYYRPEYIPRSKFKTIPTILIREFVNRSQLPIDISKELNELFDFISSYRIGDPDVLVGWPGFVYRTLSRSKSNSITTVVDADHISYPPEVRDDSEFYSLSMPSSTDNLVLQKQILDEEYKKYDIKKTPVNTKVVKKELREYLAADYIVVPTQYVYDTMVNLGLDESKLRKIPFGVDTELFRPNPTKQGNEEKLKILFAGQITLRKGVQYLLKAVDELGYEDLELRLVGNVREDIKPLLNKYEGAFNLINHKPHKELSSVYSESDVFVFPSLLEGFGMVVSEAMACGLPVITTKHTGGVELITPQENGFLTDIRDVDALKNHIKYFYENPDEITRMGNNARETAENYTWDNYGSKTNEVYNSFDI